MKAITIILAIALIAAVVLSPVLSNLEIQRQNAAAERVYAEARLEEARADTAQARADAFSQRAVVLLPWALMIIAGAFVAIMLIIVIGQNMRHPTMTSDPTSYLPKPSGTRIDTIAGPIYMIQFPTESRQQFMDRVAAAERMLDQRRLS